MQKQVRIALVVLLIGLLGVIVWQGLGDRESEPMYQGKSLRGWLHEYATGLNSGVEKQVRARNTAEDAVRKIGTNAIPTFLRMLRKKDSAVTSKLVYFWAWHLYSIPRWLRYPSWFRNQAANLNNEAELGFDILGPEAQQAVPALIAIYEENISPPSQAATSRALIGIGPAAEKVAIPSFVRAAASSNAAVREVAVFALSAVEVDPSMVVPALVEALGDTNFLARAVAANGLARFGTNAQLAVPALVPLLSDPNSHVRRSASIALKQIDPEASTKAGVP